MQQLSLNLSALVLFLSFQAVCQAVHYPCEQNRVPCGCGHAPVTTQSRVVGGEEAIPYSWSMIVSLRYDCQQTGDPTTHCCAGTILSESYILTAAHCVEQFDTGPETSAWLGRLTIAAGIHNRSFAAEQTIRTVDRIVVHPEWIRGGSDFRYDIALIHLSKSIDLALNSLVTRTCQPSKMDTLDEMMQHPLNGTRLIIIGWGRLGTNDPYSDVLQQVVVHAVHHHDRICTNSLYDPTIQFCAGTYAGGQGSCYGDSGGPVLQWAGNRWEQIGIVSYAKRNCAVQGSPTVSTRLSFFHDWIESYLHDTPSSSTISTTFIAIPEIYSSTTLPNQLVKNTTQLPAQTTYPCQRLPDYCGCSANNVVVIAHQPHLQYQEARPYSWSMIVSIRINGTEHSCGGTILSDSYILTSAQCVFDFRHSAQIAVVAGVHSLSETVIAHRKVDQVHLHPDYSDRWPFLHDIALLHLDHSLAIADTIWRLAKTCVSDDFPRPASDLIVAGWYSPRSNSKTPDVLQQTVVRSLDNDHASCASAIRNTRHQFCATLFASDPDSNFTSRCVGTSGDPVFIYRRNHWEQIGIRTRDHGCDMAAGVGLYTRLPPYTDWMRKVMDSSLPEYPTSAMISQNHGEGTFIFALLVLLIVISCDECP